MFQKLTTCTRLVGALLIALTLTHATPLAHASGDYEEVSAGVQGNCRRALNSRTPAPAGTVCTFAVSYYYSGFSQGSAIPKDAHRIVYWIETRQLGVGSWRRFSREHIVDRNGVSEKVSFKVSKSAEFRVAFDTYGQHAFPELYSDIVPLYTR